jgi:hypothetical protein
MRLRFFGRRAIVLDAASEIPTKVTVAEILESNRRRWSQGEVAPAEANRMEQNVLVAANAENRRFWEAPAGKTFSQAELRAPSHAAGIKTSAELRSDPFPAYVNRVLTPPLLPPDPRVEGLTSEMLALRAMNKRNADFWAVRH